MNKKIFVLSGHCFAVLVFAVTCLFSRSLYADQKLDQMMQQMDSKGSTGSSVKDQARQAAQYVYQGISSVASGISSWLSSVSTAPAEDAEDYDAAADPSDSGGSRLGGLWQSASGALASSWQQAKADAEATADAIRNFPLPHFYWAPGIVGDYTNVLFDRIDREFFPQ